MVPPPRVLIQLDTDPHASSFDAMVALDAGVGQLLSYHGVTPEDVESLVHGAIFTRGGNDLARTAIFVGGSDIKAGEQVLKQVCRSFLGPLRVSVMLDSNGSNTTAVAAVLAASRHVDGSAMTATILAATGPVGQRIAQLIVGQGGVVQIVSRSRERAESLCRQLASRYVGCESRLTAIALDDLALLTSACHQSQAVFSAGAAGVALARLSDWSSSTSLRVVVDLNAVPPLGIEGVEGGDRGTDRNGVACYGALGIGRTKMKIHRAAIGRMFTRTDLVLDAAELLLIGREVLEETPA